MFSVEATAECGELTYQWFKDGGQINDTSSVKYSGSTTAILTINNLTHPADEGSYFVRIINPAGSIDSNTATLDICK